MKNLAFDTSRMITNAWFSMKNLINRYMYVDSKLIKGEKTPFVLVNSVCVLALLFSM